MLIKTKISTKINTIIACFAFLCPNGTFQIVKILKRNERKVIGKNNVAAMYKNNPIIGVKNNEENKTAIIGKIAQTSFAPNPIFSQTIFVNFKMTIKEIIENSSNSRNTNNESELNIFCVAQ